MGLGGRKRTLSSEARQPRRQQPAPRQEFFSYHASSRQQQASQQTVRHPSSRQGRTNATVTLKTHMSREKLPLILALVVFGLSVLYTTMLTSNPRVTIEGGDGFKVLRPVDAYQQAAEDILTSSVLNRSKLTINTEGVKKDLQQRFPELSDVEIMLPLTGHRPVIQAISERPALLLASQKGVFVIGENGKVLMKSSDSQSLPQLPSVRDEANLDIEPGRSVLSAKDVDFITSLYQQFESKQIVVNSLTLPVLASELHVRLSDQPYYIKFSLLTDPRIVAGQYIALKKKLDSDRIIPAEYIDSRVEERIFYK